MNAFNLEIVTPDKQVFSGNVQSVQVPGAQAAFRSFTITPPSSPHSVAAKSKLSKRMEMKSPTIHRMGW